MCPGAHVHLAGVQLHAHRLRTHHLWNSSGFDQASFRCSENGGSQWYGTAPSGESASVTSSPTAALTIAVVVEPRHRNVDDRSVAEVRLLEPRSTARWRSSTPPADWSQDIRTYINRALLIDVWDELWLSPAVHEAWDSWIEVNRHAAV